MDIESDKQTRHSLAILQKDPGPCATDRRPQPGLPRRRFVHILSAASAGVAGLLGGLVGFAPSAHAAPPSRCDFDPLRLSGCRCRSGQNSCGCIGNCSDTLSRCQFGPRDDLDYCVVYNTNPNPDIGAKAFAKCNDGTGKGWCCGIYC